MERGSDKHGPRVDEQLEKEVDVLEVDPETEPVLHGGVPEGMTDEDLERRAELAALLGKEIWPAEGSGIKQRLVEVAAPDRLIDLVSAVPDGRIYDNVAEVWYDLTGQREQHRF